MLNSEMKKNYQLQLVQLVLHEVFVKALPVKKSRLYRLSKSGDNLKKLFSFEIKVERRFKCSENSVWLSSSSYLQVM
jgi:hypothetical protein